MPKEHAHWHLARRIADRLEPGPLADAAVAYDEFLLAGAVSHDSGYYVRGNPEARAGADRLHGAHGVDTFAPFRALAAARSRLGAPGFAFGLGALTHLAADAVFHPLVYSWTGDEGAPDPDWAWGWEYRHRACETALDLHLDALWGPPPARRFSTLVRQGRKDLIAVHTVFSGEESLRWVQAHGRWQRWLANPLVAWAARATAWGQEGGDPSSAFYRGRPVVHPAFAGTMEWVDPVTGGTGRASLEQLVERCESLALGLAAGWERAWVAGDEPFAGRRGPNLDTGLPGDHSSVKRFFSPRWF